MRDNVVVAENLTIARCARVRTTPSRSAKASSAVSRSGNYNDIKDGDVIETFEMREKPRA